MASRLIKTWVTAPFITLLFLVPVCCFCYLHHQSLDEEQAFLDEILVCNLLIEYMDTHDGAWPRSWEDLEKMPLPEHWHWMDREYWQEMSYIVKRHVALDFDVDVDKIDTTSFAKFEEDFHAVRPIGKRSSLSITDIGKLFSAIPKHQQHDADAW